MNIKFYMSALLTATLAQAQVPTVLIEACNALPDTLKRLECLKATMQQGTVPASTPPTVAAIDAVDKAFTRMKSNLDIGISYNNYQTALLDLAQPVAELKRVGGNLSVEGLVLLDESLATYSDTGTFWATSISFYARSNNQMSYFGGLPVMLTNMDWLVSKYGLSTTNADLLGFHTGLHVTNTRTTLWAKAAIKATKGIELLRQAEIEKLEAAKAEEFAKAQKTVEAAKQAAAVAEAEREAKLKYVEVDGITWQRPVPAQSSTAVSLKSKRVEIATNVGTTIYAAASGHVTYADSKLKGFGKMVIIKHSDRFQTAYAQNNKLQVNAGDTITQGQVIAESGEMLVYEVRSNGSAVNPAPYWPIK